jgi:hypothetical protein
MGWLAVSLAAIGLLTPAAEAAGTGPGSPTCSRNGRALPCEVSAWQEGRGSVANLAVTWPGEGRQTYYAFYRSRVLILEDSGMPSGGQWYPRGTSVVIQGSWGERTTLPWCPPSVGC